MSERFHFCLLCAICLFVIPSFSSAQKDSAYVARFFEQEISAKWSPAANDSIEAFEKKMTNRRKREFYHFFFARYLMQNGKFQESLLQAKKGTKLLDADTSNFGLIKFYNLIASNASYTKDYVTAVQYFNRSIAISEAHGPPTRNSDIIRCGRAGIPAAAGKAAGGRVHVRPGRVDHLL